MKAKKYPLGIYDNYWTGRSVKIIGYAKIYSISFTTLQFTNDPIYGKSYFDIPTKDLKKFLKGYVKRI